MASHFESRSGAVYLTQLRQDPDGRLMALRTRPLDFSPVYGELDPLRRQRDTLGQSSKIKSV